MRRKGVLITLLFLWIYLVGMGILLYPAINNYYTSKRMEGSVESFYGANPTESTLDNLLTTEPIAETEPPTPYPGTAGYGAVYAPGGTGSSSGL